MDGEHESRRRVRVERLSGQGVEGGGKLVVALTEVQQDGAGTPPRQFVQQEAQAGGPLRAAKGGQGDKLRADGVAEPCQFLRADKAGPLRVAVEQRAFRQGQRAMRVAGVAGAEEMDGMRAFGAKRGSHPCQPRIADLAGLRDGPCARRCIRRIGKGCAEKTEMRVGLAQAVKVSHRVGHHVVAMEQHDIAVLEHRQAVQQVQKRVAPVLDPLGPGRGTADRDGPV